MRLNYFDYFRGIAIILIVAGHSKYNAWNADTFLEMNIANLITGGTVLFVFISGFFFHRVYYPKFQLRKFLIKKATVYLPYLFLSSLAFIVFLVILDNRSAHIAWSTDGITSIVLLYFRYLWTGEILAGYWYIPFIVIIFTLSPLFLRYINMSLARQLVIYTILMSISVFIHRPLGNLSPIHSLIYFTPIYLLGILYSAYEERISKFIENKSFALAVVTIGISMAQVAYTNSYGSYHKSTMFSYEGVDLMILQKTVMIFFFLSILKKINDKEIPLLKYLASLSFAIYFLHPWVLEFLRSNLINQYLLYLPGGIVFLIKLTLSVMIPITIATLIKRVLGERSRYIIGY